MNARGEWRFIGATFALLGAALAPCLARGQGPEPAPLFQASSIVELTLAAPMRTLVVRRARRPDVTGTVSYAGPDGANVTLDVEVTTRGRSRLEICSFPPIRLDFKRSQVEGTLFAQQNRLKLVTLCRESNNYAQYLELEYLIYRIYEQVSAFALKVRPVIMHYVETERSDRTEDGPGFLIEPVDGLAERTGTSVATLPSVPRDKLDPLETAVLALFQFMIGNTDWSVTSPAKGEDCCHNSEVLARTDVAEQYVPVPYDFDQAGLINTVYALPAEGLKIRSVRDRLYRGLCIHNAELDTAIARFDAARSSIEALINDAHLDDRFREDAAEYIAEFYAIIDDSGQRQGEIVDNCRGIV
jgi:hypothetical protein